MMKGTILFTANLIFAVALPVYLGGQSMQSFGEANFGTEWNQGYAGDFSIVDSLEKDILPHQDQQMEDTNSSFSDRITSMVASGVSHGRFEDVVHTSFSMSLRVLYQLHERWQTGLYLGYDTFGRDTPIITFPIALNLDYKVIKFSPQVGLCIGLAGGYGIPAKRTDRIIGTNAGGFLYPSTRLMMHHLKSGWSYFVEFGYRFQQGVFEFTAPWGGESFIRENRQFRRLTLSFGLGF